MWIYPPTWHKLHQRIGTKWHGIGTGIRASRTSAHGELVTCNVCVCREEGMFIALVEFLGPDKGGRNTHPESGYHPQIDAGGEFTSCTIESLNEETLFAFYTPYRVALRLLFPTLYQDRFSISSTVQFYEGSRLVGIGPILEVC